MLYPYRKTIDSRLTVLSRGEEYPIHFRLDDINPSQHLFKLRLRGDVDIQQNWMWEGGYPLLYRDIDDSLCDTVRESCQFSLHFRPRPHKGTTYPQRAYCKLYCPPELTPQFVVPGGGLGIWRFSARVKADCLAFMPTGGAGVRFEIWKKREGVFTQDINDPPHEIINLSFRAGSYDFTAYRGNILITEETAVILVTFYAEKYEGNFWVEDPRLENNGQQILPQFTLSNPHHEYLNWMGENLSRKEWTDLGISVNGVKLPDAALFQRCHRGCEHEIPLPDGCLVKGDNTITLTNCNDYFAALPFRLMQCELIYEERRPFEIIYYPEFPEENSSLPVLVYIPEAGKELCLTSSDSAVQMPASVRFTEPGLQVIKGRASSCANVDILLESGGYSQRISIKRTVRKDEDGVLSGTSDAIYIPQDNKQLMQEFLCWYFANRLGNYISFRPVYRWTGARELYPETWAEIRRLCTELGIWYSHVIDGRELPGMNANPTKEMLASPYYIGNQGHEWDGAFYYWHPRSISGSNLLFNEIFRKNRTHPDFDHYVPIHYTEHGNFAYMNPFAAQDMRQAAVQLVGLASRALRGIKRHTGPSVLFKYFFMAGLEVGGAELMYGPQEIILSALRGASLAYNRKELAAHLAVQWSTTPHDTPERFARYRLALYVSYLQGVHHINTEEGLYRIEELFSTFDRFSGACLGHTAVQKDFTEFVNTHSRRGKMRNVLAILHGQYDGWVCFTRPNVFACQGDDWKFGYPEESWDLLKLFYPDSELQALYLHPCPNEPQGFFSRTPYGNVDILPIEADERLLESYPYLAFLGYNAATAEQVEKLRDYVKRGGKLLLTLAHLNSSVERADINHSHVIPPQTDAIFELLGFTPDYTETSAELVRHPLGKGMVYLVNSVEYPAHPSIRAVYESCLLELAGEAIHSESEKGTVTTGDTVQFAVYDQENGMRTIYLINTNWWDLDRKLASAALHYCGRTIAMEIPFGEICTLTLQGDYAVLVCDNTTEVISLQDGMMQIQGSGTVDLLALCPGDTEWKRVNISLSGVSGLQL